MNVVSNGTDEGEMSATFDAESWGVREARARRRAETLPSEGRRSPPPPPSPAGAELREYSLRRARDEDHAHAARGDALELRQLHARGRRIFRAALESL